MPLNNYELADRVSSDSNDTFDLDAADFESQRLTTSTYVHRRQPSSPSSLLKSLPLRIKDALSRGRFRSRTLRRSRGRAASRRLSLLHLITAVVVGFVVLTALFGPSYTTPPAHYQRLKKTIEQSTDYGRANPENQKIFIATSLYDRGGDLVRGSWGRALLELIDLLGNRNVFLSIFENDAGEEARIALEEFKDRVQCQNSIVFERHVSLKTIPSVTMPDGSERTKRIAYLAAMRNRALSHLDQPLEVKYDKVLFLNDVLFNPVEAAQLLLSTNTDEDGKSSYLAACAVDFINPFKFYDTFATRDAEGYSMGVPFFPWFSSAGKGISRADVSQGKDAVRVKSCWGGMVAFDASMFQVATKDESMPTNTSNVPRFGNRDDGSKAVVRFRAESDLYWEASECCLIHADLQIASNKSFNDDDVGIYMNPYVRVAYDTWTLKMLRITRRFERLYAIPHYLVNILAGMPRYNPRRTEVAGKEAKDRVWVANDRSDEGGSFQETTQVAGSGGYCGFRTLQLMKEAPEEGEKNWETVPVPKG